MQFARIFFSFSTYTYYECRDLEVLLLKYAIDDIGMHFFYVLFPLALKSLAVIPILSKYWFSKQFPFDCQCVFMTRLKSVFLRSNKSESHEAWPFNLLGWPSTLWIVSYMVWRPIRDTSPWFRTSYGNYFKDRFLVFF